MQRDLARQGDSAGRVRSETRCYAVRRRFAATLDPRVREIARVQVRTATRDLERAYKLLEESTSPDEMSAHLCRCEELFETLQQAHAAHLGSMRQAVEHIDRVLAHTFAVRHARVARVNCSPRRMPRARSRRTRTVRSSKTTSSGTSDGDSSSDGEHHHVTTRLIGGVA